MVLALMINTLPQKYNKSNIQICITSISNKLKLMIYLLVGPRHPGRAAMREFGPTWGHMTSTRMRTLVLPVGPTEGVVKPGSTGVGAGVVPTLLVVTPGSPVLIPHPPPGQSGQLQQKWWRHTHGYITWQRHQLDNKVYGATIQIKLVYSIPDCIHIQISQFQWPRGLCYLERYTDWYKIYLSDLFRIICQRAI